MSELINTRANREDIRWRLLTAVSATALMASIYSNQVAHASDDDSDRPVLWIELGGQLERLDDEQVPFAPQFFDAVTKGGFESPLVAGRPAIFSNGAEGTIAFTPNDSDWVFSGAVRYGRSEGHRFVHQQPPGLITHDTVLEITRTISNYAETRASDSQAHLIADFQAGKDVGLGVFGRNSISTLSLGVRFAQFTAKSDVTIRARPDDHFVPIEIYGFPFPNTEFHRYFGSAKRTSSFHGLGPSISWKASSPLVGHAQDGEVSLDWGLNAAVLFGKQRARVEYLETGHYKTHSLDKYYTTNYQRSGGHDNVRSVTVPNIGGFAGVSFLYSNAKISLGYRADFFFGAIDGGLDTAKKETRGFYGPFVSVSVGLGG